MTTLRPYPEYKPSGIAWLGQLPCHWEARRIKHVSRLNPSEREMDATSDDDLVTFVPMERLGSDGSIDTSLARPYGEVKSGLTYFGEGDVILAKITPCFENGKSAAVHKLPGGQAFGSTEYHVMRPTRQISSDFLYRIVSSKPFLLLGEENMEGSAGQKRVPTDFVANLPLSLPPLDEQRAIADFLDAMDERITRFIAARRRMIALLDEQKQAVINQAVTRGLDPDVPMKSSGVEWLGEIPAHWEVKPIGYFSIVGNGSTPSRSKPEYWGEKGFPWLNSSVVNRERIDYAEQYVTDLALAECHLPIVNPGDLLIGITGQGRTRGMAAVVGMTATINQHMACVRVTDRQVNPEYVRLVLRAAYANLREISSDSGSTKGALTCSDVRHYRIPIPPKPEQHGIIKWCQTESEASNQSKGRLQRELELIEEYRTRMISDVVTGKLDVRGVELPMIEEMVDFAIEEMNDPSDVETGEPDFEEELEV